MDRLERLQMYVRVVESGSFSAVAREMGVGQPAVSKAVAALEAHLGMPLLHRTSRSLALTDAGQAFYTSALQLLGDWEAAEAQVRGGQAAHTGLVRVSMAPFFGAAHVVPRLPAFFARYPRIAIETLVSDRRVNLIEDGVDVAIRHGDLQDSALTARKIATAAVTVVGSAAYLEAHGTPQDPADLAKHACVVFMAQGGARPWGFRHGSSLPARGAFRTNNAEHVRAAVLADMGLAQVPTWLFAHELATGAVRAVLQEHALPGHPISAVHPSGRRLAGRVRVFVDFLAEAFAAEPNLIR